MIAGQALIPFLIKSFRPLIGRLKYFPFDPDYGRRVTEGLGLEIGEVERLAGMSQEQRAKATEQGTYGDLK